MNTEYNNNNPRVRDVAAIGHVHAGCPEKRKSYCRVVCRRALEEGKRIMLKFIFYYRECRFDLFVIGKIKIYIL